MNPMDPMIREDAAMGMVRQPAPAVPVAPELKFNWSAVDKDFLKDTLDTGLKLQQTAGRKWAQVASESLRLHLHMMVDGGHWLSHTTDPAALEMRLAEAASTLAERWREIGCIAWGLDGDWNLLMALATFNAMDHVSIASFLHLRLAGSSSPSSSTAATDSAPVRARVVTVRDKSSGTVDDLGLDVSVRWLKVAQLALRDMLLAPLAQSVPWLEPAFRHGPMRLPIRVSPPPQVVSSPEPRRRSRRK